MANNNDQTMTETLLEAAYRRVVELENLLLVTVTTTVWPAEVELIFSQVERASVLPPNHQSRLLYHINRMWLERMPAPAIVVAASSLAAVLEKCA